jgi:hypothetical protein
MGTCPFYDGTAAAPTSGESRTPADAAASLGPHPVRRTPLEIHHRKNPDAARLDLVGECVGKSEEATTNGTAEDHASFGMVFNGP